MNQEKKDSKQATEAQKADNVAQAPETSNQGTLTFGQKPVKIPPNLLAEREKLIQEINSNQTPRSDHQVTYRYTALNPDGKIIKNTFVAFSKMEVFTFFENEGMS